MQNTFYCQNTFIHYFCIMKQKQIALYIDLLFCLVILPIVITLVPVEKWIIHHTAFMIALIVYLYSLYAIYRISNLPSLFMQKKYVKAVLIIVCLLLVTELMSQYPLPEAPSAKIYEARKHLRMQTVWFFFLVVTGFTLAIELVFELFEQILQKHEIEAEKNKAELALYKSQIDPHFLFNTLNSLYGLVISHSEHTESAFIKFSDILKYMYSQADSDTIDIKNEISYIQQYVDLQKLRLNHHTQVQISSSVEDEYIQIAPMILITFIENAFKYGTSSDEDCQIDIRLNESGGIVHFEVKNDIMRKRKEHTPAVGIANCKKRLELLYPDKHHLSTSNKGQQFIVTLTLDLRP